MSRRFVNLVVDRCIGVGGRRHSATTLHRINPWRCFYPTTQHALAAAAENSKAFTVEDARLPRAAISFYDPIQPENWHGHTHFASLGGSDDGVVSMDPDGNTFLYDGATRGLRVMPAPHAPKNASVSIAVGDDLYILERNPGTDEEDHSFEALIHRAPSGDVIDGSDEKWFWRALPPPPYAYDGYDEDGEVGDYEKGLCLSYESNANEPYPYVVRAYAVVGDSQIWISTRGGGTFSFDTAGGVWSVAGDWALPFYGRIEYAPEHGLWFGFTSEGRQFAACDLGAASPTRPPVLKKVWDELAAPPPRWAPVMASLLPMGGGKFCVARMFDLAPEGWCRGKSSNDYLDLETFVVLTGVEVVRGSRGALRMIRHKSRRYSVSCRMARLL